MPTISQLPVAATVDPADAIPVSQGGVAKAAALGTLLSQMQPAIIIGSPSLLGRTSLGSGCPEQINLGAGLVLASNTLVANGGDHGSFPVQTTLDTAAHVVISGADGPALLAVTHLRDLFAAGQHVTIDAAGVISASGSSGTVSSGSITALPAASVASAQDLVAISQSGTDHAISLSALLDGQTIDMALPAAAASDSDEFWVAQGSSTMLRQTFAAAWSWISGKLPTVAVPTVELQTDTTLDRTVHNGRLLICTHPLTLTPLTVNMGSGFHCEVINISAGNVTLASGFVTSTGATVLTPGLAALIRTASYSSGTLVYASIAGATSGAAAPGQVTGLTSPSHGASSIALSWSAPAQGGSVSSYVVESRVAGQTTWVVAAQALSSTSYTLTNLSSGTPYDIAVSAVGAGGTSARSTISVSTAAALSVPGQPQSVACGSATSSSITVTWQAPATGGSVASYTVQYRLTGASSWTGSISGVTATTQVITGLASASAYDVTVLAVNAAGSGAISSTATGSTTAVAGAVSSISWNIAPSGSYAHGVGAIGVNVHVNPASAAVQMGFSTSSSVPPASSDWVAAVHVNSDLWGAYVPAPATAGTWFAWVEGVDGSAATVASSSFTVT